MAAVPAEVVVENPEDQAAALASQMERLQQFSAGLAKKRDQWVTARAASGVEKRWQEDADAYHSRDIVTKGNVAMMDSVQQGGYPIAANTLHPTRSTVYIGITRQKTNAGEARFSDIVLPTDDRNWGIKETPVPQLVGQEADKTPVTTSVDPKTGQAVPITVGDVAQTIQAQASKAAAGMQLEIEDQLTECDYNGEVRKTIHSSAVLGTGVLKGPIVEQRVKRVWNPLSTSSGAQVHELTISVDKKPASESVDVWDVFPDPACGDNIHRGSGVYERRYVPPKEVRAMAKQPGYIPEMLREVLTEGPKQSSAQDTKLNKRLEEAGISKSQSGLYEVWEYWGEVDPEDLRAAGVDVPDDKLFSVSGVVIMINDKVVKAFLNPLDTEEFPYDFFVWEKVEDSVWGYGIPRLMMSQQKVLNAAWRQMMDNAGQIAGGQIVVNRKAIEPADGNWTITSRKVWVANHIDTDVNKAFSIFQFDNNQSAFESIINLALKFLDDETSMPMITQGEKGTAPDTVGGMQMLMNSANVVLRRLVKQFDDMITRPHIRRYYDWNMQNNPKSDIKGDFSVDARGSSALLIRDIQNQALIQIAQLAGNPVFGIYIDPKRLFEQLLKSQHLVPSEIMRDDTEIEKIKQAQQQQQPDPRVQVAEINAKLKDKEITTEAQLKQAELQQQGQLSLSELQASMANLQKQLENAVAIATDRNKTTLAVETMRQTASLPEVPANV